MPSLLVCPHVYLRYVCCLDFVSTDAGFRFFYTYYFDLHQMFLMCAILNAYINKFQWCRKNNTLDPLLDIPLDIPQNLLPSSLC